MRELMLAPAIIATYHADQLRVQGVPVQIVEVTDGGGIHLQAWVNLGTLEKPMMATRTYILSGEQFCALVSEKVVPDPGLAGLLMAKNRLTRQQRDQAAKPDRP